MKESADRGWPVALRPLGKVASHLSPWVTLRTAPIGTPWEHSLKAPCGEQEGWQPRYDSDEGAGVLQGTSVPGRRGSRARTPDRVCGTCGRTWYHASANCIL